MTPIRSRTLSTPWTSASPVHARPSIKGSAPAVRPADTVTLSGGPRVVNEVRDATGPLERALDGRTPTPSDIATCLALGRVDVAVAVAARLSGCPTSEALEAYRDGDPADAMAQLASVGVDAGTAGWLLRGLGNVAPVVRQAASAAYVDRPRVTNVDEVSEPMDLRI